MRSGERLEEARGGAGDGIPAPGVRGVVTGPQPVFAQPVFAQPPAVTPLSAVDPRLAATQLVAIHQVLAHENSRKIVDGRTATEVRDDAVSDSDRALHLLDAGLADQYG